MADLSLSELVAIEYATGKLDVERAALVPSIPPPAEDLKSLRASVLAMKQILDARENRVGSVLDKNLTFRDLMDSSALRVKVGPDTYVGNAAASLTINSAPFGDTRPTLSTPPVLTNLAATGAFRQILLTWDRYAYRNHSYVEVYRHTSDAIGSAALIGTTTADIYDDSSGVSGTIYHYWVRAVNSEGQHGAFNAVAGVSATLAQAGTGDLTVGSITAASGIIGDLTADVITTGTLAAARIAAGSLDAAKITAGTITADRFITGLFQADNVLTRGLTVRDSSGNVILAAGTNLDLSRVANALDLTVHSAQWSLSGTTLTRVSGGPNLNQAAQSRNPLTGGAYCEGTRAAGTNHMLALTTDPSSAATYTTLDYAIQWAADGQVYKYENNTQTLIHTNHDPGDIFAVSYDGFTVRYLQNGIVRSTTAAAEELKLYMAVCLYADGDTVANLKFGPLSPGVKLTSSNVSTYIASAAITSAYIGSLNADVINSGSIRGISVVSSTHATKGSYLTAAASAADGTLTMKDTTDFHASGGTVHFMDTTNDRDVATYTGKTSTTLTGCSGVLAHNSGAFVVPVVNNGTGIKSVALNSSVNELRFWGDRGDGTVEELASIGIVPSGSDYVVGLFGSDTSSRTAVQARNNGAGTALFGRNAGSGFGVQGFSGSGSGVVGNATSGPGGHFVGNATMGNLYLPALAARPSATLANQLAILYTTGGSAGARTATPRLCMHDGTNWIFVHDNSTFAG